MVTVFRGVLVPVLTPFERTGAADGARFEGFCRWLLAEGADGLAMFGTTSEGNSLAVDERIDLLDRLVAAGLDPARFMPGTGACALPEAIRACRHAVALGVGGVLSLPPFYYKGVSDDGLFAWFAGLIEGVGDARLRLYLYHIPPVAQVGFPLPLIERLVARYPGVVAGIKDSSGDFENTRTLLSAGLPDFAVFAGSETFLLATLRLGGAGCITATGNVNVAGIRRVYQAWQAGDAGADDLQEQASAVRRAIQGFPMIPALKALVARAWGDPEWARPRPPLQPLADTAAQSLHETLAGLGFAVRAPEPSSAPHPAAAKISAR